MKLSPRSRKWKRIRAIEQNPNCAYCGEAVTLETATFDHVIPKSRGGSNARGNRVLCCKKCNWLKADRTAAEFAVWLLSCSVRARLVAESAG